MEGLETESKQLRSDLGAEKHLRRLYQEQTETVTKNVSRNQFVHVLVDGDGYVFSKKYLENAESGATEAAYDLHSAVKDYLR